MADSKISALPASTTPLAGTEVLPIVQSSVTKQVSIANLTAGRAISATSVTASTGNFVVGTSGQGIDFSATPGTGTSELFNDYEEGTWTPNQGGGLTVIGTFSSDGRYTVVGRVVTISGHLYGSTSIACGAANYLTTNLPVVAGGESTGTAVNGSITASVGTVAGGSNLFASGALAASSSIFFSISYTI